MLFKRKILYACDGEFPPLRATKGSAGMDIYNNGETVALGLNEIEDVQTLTAFKIPKGYVGYLHVRSGIGFRGVTMINGVGVIDSDYTQYVGLRFYNVGTEPVTLERGERVAQLVVHKDLRRTKRKLSLKQTKRGGFGSTGRF